MDVGSVRAAEPAKGSSPLIPIRTRPGKASGVAGEQSRKRGGSSQHRLRTPTQNLPGERRREGTGASQHNGYKNGVIA